MGKYFTSKKLAELGMEVKNGVAVRKSAAKRKPAIRMPKSKAPNKTEQRMIDRLRSMHPRLEVRYEAVTFLLPSGCKYTPDVTVWDGDRIIMIAEVKGAFIHNQRSVHAFKEAAAAYPKLNWVFAQWSKGEWLISGNEPEATK